MYHLFTTSLLRSAAFLLLGIVAGASPTLAQTVITPSDLDNFVLSKNEDFSTNDRIFDREDIVHMKIDAPAIDFTGLAISEYVVEPGDGSDAVKGEFENQFDGTYVARFDLSTTNSDAIRWTWHAVVEDDKGNQFEAEAEFFVGDPSADGIEIEISGVLEEIGEGFFLFYGRKVFVTDQTEIVSENGDLIRLSDLAIGDQIKVLILITGEGDDLQLTALHIYAETSDHKDEIEVTGEITELGERAFVVQELVFAITDDTKFIGPNEETLSFEDLTESMVVTVLGQYLDDSSLIALVVIVEDEDRGEFSIVGHIDVIEEDAIIVQGTLFVLTDNTIILSAEGEVVRLDHLSVGDFVEVKAQLGANGLPIAITIRVEENATGLIVAEGPIEQIFDAGLVVQGRKFLVTNNTSIVDENGQPISFSGLTEGSEVTVIGQYINETEMEAVLITLGGAGSEEVHVEGAITNIEGEGVVVQDLFFMITDATIIINSNGEQLGFADLTTGLFVSVVGKRSEDGVLYATQITVESRAIVIDGQVERIDGETFYVAGFKFLVTDRTQMINEAGEEIRFESLHVGAVVLVEGEYVAVTDVNNDANNETYLALKIILLDDVREKITVSGEILEVGDERFVVGDFVFVVGNDTVVKDANGEKIDYDRLQAGVQVEVEAVVNDAGVLVAVCIQLKVDRPIRISGKIEAIEGEIVVVGGVEFIVTDDTEIISVLGEVLRPDDLQVGMLARVELASLGTDRLTAIRMHVLPRIEDEVGITGVVEAVHDRSIVVLGKTFFVASNTVIIDEQEMPMDLAGISVGRTVAIRADLLPGDGLVALKIKQLDAAVKDIQVTGPIEAVESNTIAVIGIYFFVDLNTGIYNLDGEAVSLEKMEVGQTVELFATGQPDGTRLAHLIREQDVVVVSGEIETLTDEGMTMLGSDFSFGADPLFLDELNDHLLQADLKAGQYVEIRGITANQAGKSGAPSTVTKIKVLNATPGSVSIEGPEADALPDDFVLHQNYPNPFNPTTTISFAIQKTGAVSLSVYTLLGQEVVSLLKGDYTPGTHQVQWNGRDQAGNLVASGVYLYRLQVGSEVQTRQMILLK